MPPRLRRMRGVHRGKEQHVSHRHQRGALPSRGHVTGAKAADDPNPKPPGEDGWLTQLPGDHRRLMPNGLSGNAIRDRSEAGTSLRSSKVWTASDAHSASWTCRRARGRRRRLRSSACRSWGSFCVGARV